MGVWPRGLTRGARGWAPRLGALLAALAIAAACQGSGLLGSPSESREADRERYARRRLEDARALSQEGQLEAAERSLRRGLEIAPDSAQLHRTLASVLEDLGRLEEAERHWERAEDLEPAPTALPGTPLDVPSSGVWVALLVPDAAGEQPERVAPDWPDGELAQALEKRLRVRLPEARVRHLDPETVEEARRWLAHKEPRAVISLRVERAYCGETVKNGPFAVARLRVAAEARGLETGRAQFGHRVVAHPRPPERCQRDALGRALEDALLLPRVHDVLGAAVRSRAPWPTSSIRALFPGLGRRIAAQLEAGQAWLVRGEVKLARAAFQRAQAIDPEDSDVSAYLHEVDSTLAIAHALPGKESRDPAYLDPGLSPAERAVIEAELAQALRRHDELQAARAALGEDVAAPSPDLLAALHPAEIRDPGAFGPTLARERAGGRVKLRVAYAPDGAVIARYYFPIGGDLPVLREDDGKGDGRPDRWIAYERGVRREIWEDRRGTGRPDVHLVFPAGGSQVEHVEIDADADGRPERTFDYEDGVLRAEARDTDRDGTLDRFDRLDEDGNVGVREEDLDGDGRIDVRSIYRGGKLVRREIENPEALPDT